MPQIIKGKSKWTPKLGRKHFVNQNNVGATTTEAEEYTLPSEEHDVPISNQQYLDIYYYVHSISPHSPTASSSSLLFQNYVIKLVGEIQ